MQINSTLKLSTLAALALAVVPAVASAATPSPTKSNGTYINGSGIPGNNFTVANGGGVQVALKARGFNALAGQPYSYDGINTYTVAPVYAAGRDPLSTPGNTRAWWTFDYQFSPAAGSLPSDYVLRLEQDVNPAVGATSYFTSQGLSSGIAGGGALGQFDSDGLKLNPGAGAWSDDVTPFVHSQSWNYEFNFYPGSYDPSALGEYQINLTAYLATDVGFTSPLASSSIFVQVPEPTSLAAIAGVGALSLRRGKRR